MMARLAWIALGLLAMGSPSLADGTTQFDLTCHGILQDIFEKTSRDYTFTVRVDLDQMEYCIDECSAIDRIYSVEPSELIFQPEGADPGNEFLVFRTDGKFYLKSMRNESTDPEMPKMKALSIDGTCVKAPFTPLPKLAF